MRSIVILMTLLLAMGPARAAEPVWLGKARLFTNDYLGDGKDRWRTASYSASYIFGGKWRGRNPSGFGELMEYRFRAEIIAPADLSNPAIGTDRRYVGALQFGAFSHMRRGKTDISLGLDLVVTGPQTGLGNFQSWVHSGLGMGKPAVLGSQIGNAIYPTLSVEFARDYRLLPGFERRIVFRPFLQAQAGVETYVRVGGDFTFGPGGEGDFQVRDVTTGFRSVAIKNEGQRAVSFLIGGDIAYVGSSRYLPTSSGFSLTSARVRLRAGYYYEMKHGSLFYGVTWLGREFSAQPRGQLVGSISMHLNF